MERERAKSVATLRLSEHFAKLAGPKQRPQEYESLDLKARAEKASLEKDEDGGTVDETAITVEEKIVTGRPPAHSWPAVPTNPRTEEVARTRPSLADVIEADLVLGGSAAEGELLRAIATRLSHSCSSGSSVKMKRRNTTATSAPGRAASQSMISRLSQSFAGKSKSHVSIATVEHSKSAAKPAEPTTCRYCLEQMDMADDCSTCLCTGPLCESCLQGELQLTFSRAQRVMHCTVCLHVYAITGLQEVLKPIPRFPRCYDARGHLMNMPVFMPVFLWTIFTSVYSFVDSDFSVIRGDVFFIAELAVMAFSLHFCWKSREPVRSWMRFLYTARAVRSLIVVLVWHYSWIDTIFLIFSLIFVTGSCLRRPDGTEAHEGEFSLDISLGNIGPLRLEMSDEWTAPPTFDMVRRNQEAASAEREVQVAQTRLGEVIQQEHGNMRHLNHLSQGEIAAREQALGRFLGFGNESSSSSLGENSDTQLETRSQAQMVTV